jgi:translation initiation factor IF-2
MSIRVHELAKKIGKDNKETLEILKKYYVEVKSVSSTVDNITAEAIIEEYAPKVDPDAVIAEVVSVEPTGAEEVIESASEVAQTLPEGVFVKSAEQVKREHQERDDEHRKEQEARRASAAKAPTAPPPVAPPPVAAAGRSPVAPPPVPAMRAPVPPSARPSTPPVATRAPIPAPMRQPQAVPAPLRPTPAPAAVRPVAPREESAPAPKVSPAPAASSAPKASPAPAPKAVAPVAAPAPRPAPAAPAPSVAPVAPAPSPAPAPMPVAVKPPPVASRPASAPVPSSKPVVPPPAASRLEPASAKPKDDGEKRKLQLKPPIVVKDFATRLGMKPFRLISELMEMGIFSSMNQTIDEDVAGKIADQHGFVLDVRHRGEGTVTKESQAKGRQKSESEDDPELLKYRPAVVCIMGHVDHGKTTLIDCIRKSNVVDSEFGGITQHVAAYQVEHNGKKITFLDTPGHAAFSKIRERGANVTDIVVIVVAADDGFMPQTDEALKFAKRSQAAIIVAVNKMDSKGANLDRVKRQMQERDIAPEDWGGTTICVPISALKREGIDHLLEMILLQAEVDELKANPTGNADGMIIEAQMEVGRGATAIVIVQRGTLKPGDSLVCGTVYCKARALLDANGKQLKEAPPSTPVTVMGWSDAPQCGARFERVKNDKEAKAIVEERITEDKRAMAELIAANAAANKPTETGIAALFAAIQANQKKVFTCILKADVSGSVEAIKTALQEIKSDKVSIKVISADIGPVTKNDVTRAATSNATIIAFNVGVENGVRPVAKHEGIEISHGNIIYEVIDSIRELMADLLDPEIKEVHVGTAEIRQIFMVGKGIVAGCMVMDGKILRDKSARLLRNGEVIGEGRIDTLRRFKEDVGEVRTGFECGIRLSNIDGYQEGDRIQCFDIEKIKPVL